MAHKLLLADDSVTIQRVIELTFSGEDIDIVAVNDGEEAIACIPAEHPDIVLADIGMPKRSGYDVAAFIKADPALKHIPVLLMAGAFEPVDDALAAECGCDGVLVKPFEPQHVIARVRELLDGTKGSPTRTSAAVPRPVERLALRPDDRLSLHTLEEAAPLPDPEIDRGPVTRSGADESLDEYFDRLDAAFATLNTAPAPAADRPSEKSPFDDPLGVPTLDDLLGSDFGKAFSPKPLVAPPTVEPPDAPATPTPRPAESLAEPRAEPDPPPPAHSILSDAFSALLAVEQGDPGAAPVRLTSRSAEPVITEAFMEEVVRRVLERISSGAAREIVADIVSDVAERLVREEIERIRKRQ